MAYADMDTLFKVVRGDPDFNLSERLDEAVLKKFASPSIEGPALVNFDPGHNISILTAGLACHVAEDMAAVRAAATRREIVSTGQCAALVQNFCPSVGMAHCWIQGPRVMNNQELPPGIAIAAGWRNRRYPNMLVAGVHNTAMIFIGHETGGKFKGFHQGAVPAQGEYSGAFVDTVKPHSGTYKTSDFFVILTLRRASYPTSSVSQYQQNNGQNFRFILE